MFRFASWPETSPAVLCACSDVEHVVRVRYSCCILAIGTECAFQQVETHDWLLNCPFSDVNNFTLSCNVLNQIEDDAVLVRK